MAKNRILSAILFIIILALFSSCYKISKEILIWDHEESEVKKSEYLSISYTTYNDDNGPENGMTTVFIKYDVKEKKLTEIMGAEYTSQYPLGIISIGDNKVYYTAESGTKAGNDGLYSYDILTKETQQLTDRLFAINYILPRENDVILVGVKRGTSAIRLIQYDKRTGKIFYNHLQDDDTCIEYAGLNINNSDELYVVTYSDNARRASSQIQASGNADHYIIPDYTILKYGKDLVIPEPINTVKNGIVRSVSGNGRFLVTKEVDSLELDTYKLYIQNLDDKEKIPLDIKGIAKCRDLQIDSEGRRIYFIGIIEHSDDRAIFCYDMELKTLETIFTPEAGIGFINNFTLVCE